MSEPRILLKARPTPAQLDDRLAEPAPEGLELYLDARDIADDDWLARLTGLIDARPAPPGFTWLVEGPLRSLDGAFFDLTVDSAANREVLRRIASFGERLGALACCVHLIAPTAELAHPDRRARADWLARAVPLAREYVARCRDAGMTPTIENVPPVARMREGRLMSSPVGVFADDLLRLAERAPGLAFCLDLSHAQLSVNAQTGVLEETGGELAALTASIAAQAESTDLFAFLATLAPGVVTVHVSDASGLTGEGLPWGAGMAPLEAACRQLMVLARFFVTETIEPNPDASPTMRAVERRLRAIRSGAPAAAGGAR